MKKLIAILMVSILLFTSCSANDTDKNVDENSQNKTSNNIESTQEQQSEYPIYIENAFGQTQINDKPQNVAAIAWGNADVALALGVSPVIMPKANFGQVDENGLAPWTAEAISALGGTPVIVEETDGIDFEAINDVNPDVILAAYSGITRGDYDILNEIAPVVAYKTNAWQTSWREQILLNAKGMGMEKEGIALISELDEIILEKTAQYPNIAGKNVVFTYFNPSDLGNFYVYLPIDPRVGYLEDLGMVVPKSITDMTVDTNSFMIQISAENIDKLNDADIIVTYGDESLLDILQNDRLIGTVPAVKNGAVVIIEMDSVVSGGTTPSALSIPYTIDEYLQMFDKAIGNN